MDAESLEAEAAAAERREMEGYLEDHALEEVLNELVNDIVTARPEDPYDALSRLLRKRSAAADAIEAVVARSVLSYGGGPALEVEVTTRQGSFRAAVCSGPFDAAAEDPAAQEGAARDDGGAQADEGGKSEADTPEVAPKPRSAPSLDAAIAAVRKGLGPALLGMDATDQRQIDEVLEDFADAPRNAVLALSIACCKAGARHLGREPFEHIARAFACDAAVPMPLSTVYSGASHALGLPSGFIRSISAVALDARSMTDAILQLREAQGAVDGFVRDAGRNGAPKGDRGGLVMPGATSAETVKSVASALAFGAADAERKLGIVIDVAAPSFAVVTRRNGPGGEGPEGCDPVGTADGAAADAAQPEGAASRPAAIPPLQDGDVTYDLGKWREEGFGGAEGSDPVGKDELVETIAAWVAEETAVVGLIDSFHPVHAAAHRALVDRVAELEEADAGAEADAGELAEEGAAPEGKGVGGDADCRVQLAGDASIASVADIAAAADARTLNTLLLTPEKGRTVAGCAKLAAKARACGWGVIVAHDRDSAVPCGDAFLAHLAVGVGAGQISAGALARGEGLEVCNELLRIAGSAEAPPFAGPRYRSRDAARR